MKVEAVNYNKISASLNFKGYKPAKSEYGDREYEFNYVYDDSKKDCYVEFFSVDKDSDGNYYISGERDSNGFIKPLVNFDSMEEGNSGYKLVSGKSTKIDLASTYGISPNQAFAYHYVLRPKNDPNGIPEYKIDPGNVINDFASTNNYHEIYNVVSDRASTVSRGGSMKLIMPDNNNVLWVYDNDNNIVKNPNIERARKTNKSISNKIGGSIAGIEKDLETGKLDNYTRIITTPLFTDDSLSSHGYWNKNCMQMAHSLGNINNYTSLQKKLFAKGINLVSDGAFVNEGLEGVHFKHVLQWGKKSPYFNWFRISGLQDSPLSLGVFGKKMEHTTHRLVNSKYKFEVKDDGSIKISPNKSYKSNKPTYIQIYDDRLVNTENLDDKKLIKVYDKLVESLEINTHNDTVIPYSFKIDSEAYKKNVELLDEYNKTIKDKSNKINLYSGEGTRAVTKFKHFELDGKHESGFETWDANPDIAKLSYIQSHNETLNSKNIESRDERIALKKLLKQKNAEVQDYAVTSAKYWTNKTRQILILNAAQNLKNINGKDSNHIYKKIQKLSDGKIFPKNLDININIIDNVLNGDYSLQGNDIESEYNKALLQGLMNLPLDSIEVGDDIVAVLASPYMTKRAVKDDQIGVSRYDMYKNGNKHLTAEYANIYNKTDRMYKKEIMHFAENVLKDLEKDLPKNQKLHDESGNVTPYGKYVIPILTAEIARFAIIKAVIPKTEFKYNKENGEIVYNYDETKSTSLLGMGIIADSPEDEAEALIHKLRHNINKISKKDREGLKNAFAKSLEGTSYESFALADMIVSRTESGLDWRIDATKDIGDIDSLRSGKTNFRYTWDEIIKFWTKFANGVREYHPDAYIAAEITDAADIFNKGRGYGSRYSNEKEAVKKLINEAGFTTIANYDYLSSNLTQIFGKLFDYDGEYSPDKGLYQGNTVYNQLNGFYSNEPLESLIYSYTFAGNHDKCRTLEGYAIDTDMVYSDLTDTKNYEYRKRAYKILHGMAYGKEPTDKAVHEYDYSRVSNLAIAKCESISSGMGKAANESGFSHERAVYIYDRMLKALANLSNNKYKGKVIETNGFGTKGFDTAIDIVLNEMDYVEPSTDLRLTKDEKTKLKKNTLEMILKPAMSKYLGHVKFLVALSGNSTLFAGDEYGSTGFETTTKNIFLQNRNIIREDWTDIKSPNYMAFVKEHKDNIDYQFGLRKRPELQPLNDGTPYILDLQKAEYSKPEYEDNFHDKIKGYKNGKVELSALLRQSPNGKITISIFNTEGITHKFDEFYRPAEIKLNSINLNTNNPINDKFQKIYGLKSGMKFRNANENDKTIYYVDDKNQITGPDHKPIVFKDSVLILYHEPSFTGKRILYNLQYNISPIYRNIETDKKENDNKLNIILK